MTWIALGVVAIKVLFFDTVILSPPARIIASITVGLVIIAAGVLYARLVDVIKAGSVGELVDDDENLGDEDPSSDSGSDVDRAFDDASDGDH